MKSIKQQYIDLTEGKMSQFNFMRNLRMTVPQYVTNVTSFKDAVRILKNKGILTEAKTKLTADQANPSELRMGIRVEMEHTDDPKKAEKIALDHLAENPFYYTQLKLSGVDTKALPSKEKKAIAKKKDETEFVDKANQMKPVKGIEKIKASANKAKKETNKPAKGVSSMSLVSKTVRGVKKMDPTGEKMKKINVKENMSKITPEIKQAIKDIVTYATLPSQIDYRVPHQIKASKAEKYLMSLPNGEMYIQQARKQIDSYYEEDPTTGKSASDYASMFEENKVANTIFDRNKGITAGINKLAKGEEPKKPETKPAETKPKKSAEEKLREAIRKMIQKEIYDGRDNMTDVTENQIEGTFNTAIQDINNLLNKLKSVNFRDLEDTYVRSAPGAPFNKEARIIRDMSSNMEDTIKSLNQSGYKDYQYLLKSLSYFQTISDWGKNAKMSEWKNNINTIERFKNYLQDK
jgi:hypothetical protein